ncbi:MAG: serine protease, partial [Myxococcales bacterium]|nr:serine protease [Myxococcales bacterium]
MRSLLLLLVACGPVRGIGQPPVRIDDDRQGIVGGDDALPGEYPYQVSIQTRDSFHFCGGSLISDRWVLTAAHCMVDEIPSGIRVKAGLLRLSSGGEAFDVSQILVHPGYDDDTMVNDIALVRLARASTHPRVRLMDTVAEPDFAAPGDLATITGWGTLTEDGATPNTLQSVDIPIISNAECFNAYPGEIVDSMICAGVPQGGIDSCQGDSGGPMVVDVGGELVQSGVVSWGDGCARPNLPGVYTRVSRFGAWVASHVPEAEFVSGPLDPEPVGDDHGDSIGTATLVTAAGQIEGFLDAGTFVELDRFVT